MNDPVERDEILYIANRVLKALELFDPEHFARVWGPFPKPPGLHALFLNIGDYRVECDSWGWVKVREGKGGVRPYLLELQFSKKFPIKLSSFISFRKEALFQEVMPGLDRILVLDDLSLL